MGWKLNPGRAQGFEDKQHIYEISSVKAGDKVVINDQQFGNQQQTKGVNALR